MIFLISWFIWALLHVLILIRFDFSLNRAIWDSVISNSLLAVITILITVILQFYIPQKNKYGFILALCSVLTGLWFLASRSVLMLVIRNSPDYTTFFSQSVLIRLAVAFLLTGCMALVSVLWYTVHDQKDTEKRQSEAEKLSREAELYKLRQQLQPHFLFNSLNSINALIGSQPAKARTMIEQLSDFLRGTLKKDEQQWISLDEELQHLQLYLEIEKVRFGHRLSFTINNSIQSEQHLPVMLLQPVVENAIKFGLYDTTGEININIEAHNEEGYLVLKITNPYDQETSYPKKGTGFGLASIERRLYLLFGRTDLLKTSAHKNLFETKIKIPQKNDPDNHH
jgi:two-component system LytT family sensor kinase